MSSDDAEPRITPRELLARIEAGTAPPVLDVRSRAEYEQGHVPGARHLPFWSVVVRREEVSALGEGPVVVYCGDGPRAEMAALALRLGGVRHVQLLEGHMRGWTRTGLPEEGGRPGRSA